MNAALKPPYLHMLRELEAGRVIPFLGAGASFGPRNPSKVAWRTRDRESWKMSFLPTARELAECIALEGNFPDGESRELTKVAQYYHSVIGREPLHKLLHGIFSFQQSPGTV